MPRMIRAANWIVDERHATMQQEPDGTPVPEYGLLPAGELEDNEDWEYWFAVNGYAYRGLRATAVALAAALRDGTYGPKHPARASLHGRRLGWLRNVLYGAHLLVGGGAFDP